MTVTPSVRIKISGARGPGLTTSDVALLDSKVAAAEQSAMDAAASAALAESAAGPTYPDTSSGLAATTDGQSFAVDNGDGTVTIYLNDGGSAVEQRTLATTDYLSSTDGAEAVGADDGTGGSLWTSVAGFISYLRSSAGSAIPGFKSDSDATAISVESALKALPREPEYFGTYKGQADNVTAYTTFLGRQDRSIQAPINREVPMPKLHLVSSLAAGKLFHGFPAAVRHDGKDYIIYREGDGHLETVPIASTARLVCSVRDVNGVAADSRTVIYSPAGIDPRDPCILRDDYGSAILVGGKFKVVTFEWTGSYAAGNAACRVFDLDPANLAAGLINGVTVPLPVEACRSDVRQLSTGAYAFIGYSTAADCYLVTTADWASFATELIGPGNEAAFCETVYDGTLNVVVRAEERYGHKCAIFYKRATAGGAWRIHDVLPHTLNAPTFVRAQNYRVSSVAPDGADGWLLFARDKTGRTGLLNADPPTSELVCFRSKDNYGRVIDRLTDRAVIAGAPQPAAVALSGDAHYCSVIAGRYSGQLEIYTYGEFVTGFDNNAGTTFRIGVFRIAAYVDADQGVRAIAPRRRNLLANSDFAQGAAGIDLTNANAAIAVDSVTGRNVLRISDKFTTQLPYMVADCRKGDTLFAKVTTRLNHSDLAGSGRHLTIEIRNADTDALIQTESPALNPLDFFGQWRTVVGRPIIAPADRIKIAIGTISDAGLTDAESDIAHIELSDDCSRDENDGGPVATITRAAQVTFPTPSGGATGDGTYSTAFWANFDWPVKAGGLPLAAADTDDISVTLDNCSTISGSIRCISTSCEVNPDGTVDASFAIAPGESGTLGVSVTCRAIVTVSPKVRP